MIGIGSDHHGLVLKQHLATHLAARGEDVWDFGTFSEAPVDYPDVAAAVAGAIRARQIGRAVLVCGTGLGMAIAANKVPGIFAAPVTDVYTARRARESNDVHIIALGADIVGPGLACAIVDAWLEATFAGGASARKLAKVRALEEMAEVRLRAAAGADAP